MPSALVHAQLSVKRLGGVVTDYLKIHHFIDHTKSLCSDNRHRILHTLWGVNEVIVPIFGIAFQNNDGVWVDVKELCEKDHILIDFQNKFIPTLTDFVAHIPIHLPDRQRIETVFKAYENNPQICQKLLSPLAYTGKFESLLITHNSWFLNEILPQMGIKKPELQDFTFSPDYFFNQIPFAPWMDNGNTLAPSAIKTTLL
jgi:hypothetical protein